MELYFFIGNFFLNHFIQINYFKIKIILSLFCSIPALVYSFKSVEDIESGNLQKATQNSNISRKLNIFATAASAFLSLITLIIVLTLVFVDQ